MTREEEEKLKMLSLEDEEEKPASRRTSFFTGRSATAPTNLQQKIVTPEIAEAQASYNDSLVKAEKEFENIKSNSNRDQLVDYYKAYADTLERDIKNQDQERYNVDKTILSLIDGELKKTAGVGTFLQDTGAEAWRNTKLGTADAFRNVAKAQANIETSTDGFNADTLYQIASAKPGTELSKIGQKSMTGSYAETAYKKLTDLYNAHPDDKVIADVYEKVTSQGFGGEKDYFKNTVPYLNQKLKEDKYNNSALVKNTNDEIYDVQKLKEREMLSGYGDNLFLQGVGVAGYMVPSVLAGVATSGIAGLPGASSAIASNTARSGVAGALGTNINVSGKIAQAGALGSMYMSAAGRAFDDTINAGYDWDKASLYSQLIGALEVTTEMIGGESVMGWLSGRVGGTALGKATQALVKKGGSAASRFIIGMAADVGSEIIEEEISALVEPIINKAVLGKDTTIEEYLQSALDAATGTAIPTLIMGGLGKARIASSITKTQTRLNAKIDALLGSNAITKEEATKLKETVANWTKDVVEGVYEHEEEIKNELATKKVTQTYDEAMANINKQLNSMLVGNNIVKNPEYATTREIRDLGTKTTATYSNTDTIQSDMDYIKKSNPSIKSIKPATTISKAHQNVKNFIEKITGKQVVFANIENTGDEFDYGFTNKSGNNLYLNSNLDIADTLAAGFHEAGHHFATKYSDLFNSFKSKVPKSKLATLKSKAVFKGLSEDGILEELFGNYLGSVLTNAKMTKKLEASTQSLVDSMKDMFSFASKNKNTKVSKYNVDFANYLGEAIINDKALEKEVLRTFMGNAKQQQKKAEPIKQQAKEAPKRLEKPTQKEEKKSDRDTEKANEDKKAAPKEEQTKQEAKVEKNAPKEETRGTDASKPQKKEPPKKLEPKNTLRERFVSNMVKQLNDMEVTQENIEEVLGENLDSATERQMEKLYEQYNIKDKSFNDLYDKMYEDVEKALKKSSNGDIKYSRETFYSNKQKGFIFDVEKGINDYLDEYKYLKEAIRTDTPDLSLGLHGKPFGDYYYIFDKRGGEEFKVILKIKIEKNRQIIKMFEGADRYVKEGTRDKYFNKILNQLWLGQVRDDDNSSPYKYSKGSARVLEEDTGRGEEQTNKDKGETTNVGGSSGERNNNIAYSRTINDGSFILPGIKTFDTRNFPFYTAKNGRKVYYATSKDFYNSKPQKGKIRLYTNTPFRNIDSILEKGILHEAGKLFRGVGKEYEGDAIWLEDRPDQRGYGGTTIAVEIEPTDKLYKVNDTQYMLYEDIDPKDIVFIDRPIAHDGGDPYRTSDIQGLMEEHSKKTVVKVFNDIRRMYEGGAKNAWSIPSEELNYILDTIPQIATVEDYSGGYTTADGTPITNGVEKFGEDSAMKKNGKLEKYYHGSPFFFDEFDPPYIHSGRALGDGNYVTKNKKFAEKYADGKLYEFVLNIKNPFNDKTWKRDYEKLLAKVSELVEKFDQKGIKEHPNWGKEGWIEEVQYYMETPKYGSDMFAITMPDGYQIPNAQSIMEIIKDMARRNGVSSAEIWKWLGYDGLETESEVVFFDSNQAKFLDNPNPTEDGRFAYSRTITESNDGRELTKEQQEWNEGNQVVDSKGRLKHLYHGTNNGEFYIFDKDLANAEGDWGAGFYFTDNEMDVNENYYGGGPDFEIKVDRLAEHIQEQSPTEMSYAVARERARKMLEKGEYRIDAYGKMLNPAIVGKTRLFEYFTEDLDVYREDYSSDDDYEEALIYALYDKVDEMIDEAALYVDNQTGGDVTFGDYKTIKSAISQVIAENVIEPGSGIEIEKFKDELVDRLMDAGKYDNNGTWQSYANEIVRLIIQSQGYDGIIDPTVSKKFKGMNLDSNTTHYIFFEPNQIKDVDNLNPTDNPDIRYSRNQSQSVKEMLSNIRMTENEDETETFVDNTFIRIMRKVNREIFNNAEALVQFDNKVAKAMGKKIADVPTFLKLFDNWRRAGNADSIIAQIGKGAYNEDTGEQITKGLANILGDLMPSRKEAKAMGMSRDEAMQQRIEQLIALGTAERTVELDERGIESGIDIDLAQEVIDEYEDDEELHKALDEIRADGNALIDYAVEKHVLQEETAKYIKENNLLYFPFNRVLGEDTTKYGLGKKDGAVGRAIVGIKGSNLMLENPLVSIVGNWARMLQVADQQTMIEKLKEAGNYLGEEQGLYFNETKPLVKYQGEVGMDVFKGNIAKQLEALGYDEIVDRLDWNGLYQLFVPEKSDPKKMTISYFDEQGKRRYIKFEDNDYGRPMYDIISNLNPLQSNKFLDFVNLLSQGVRLGATTMNWEFALGNMMSDSAQAYLYSEGFVVPLISSIFDIFKLGVGRGYVPTFKKDYKNYYEKYKRSGASLSGQFRGNAKYIRGKSDEVFGFREDQLFNPNEDVKAKYWLGPVSLANKNGRKALRKKASNVGNAIVNFMQFVPEYSEEATRFAEFVRVYDKLKKKGWDEIDAIKEAGIKAREITQDFSIQGNTMKSINKIIPFSAATMGGLYRFGRELRTHPVRLNARLIPMAAFVILMLETFRDDDDRKWYEEMNKQKKFDNYVINNGTSEPFIIKKPQGPARYFVNFIELIYNIANGYVEEDKIDEAVKEWAEMSIKDQLPITNASDFVPGGLQAFLENQINQDFYYGTNIVPQSLEHLDPRNQYDENTSEFSKALGNIFNWSPLKIDNVVKSSFAGLGKLFLSATDDLAAQFGANEKPAKKKGERYIIDKFYANALKNPESVNYVYDRLDELENEKAEGRMTGKEQREYEKLTTAKSTLADINKEIREIKSNEKLSAEKKTDKIEDLQELKVDVARYYQGKSLIEKSNKSKIELMEYYPSQETYTYTVDKNNKVELDFSSKATKTEYAKTFKENYDKSLEELKATQEYKQATPIEKIELEKSTKTKARTKTTNDMKKIVYERTKR